jgi:hypothetical protein
MTRLEALEAVAEAARQMLNEWDKSLDMESVEDVRARLRALDALPAPAQAQGETVEVAVWEHPDGDTLLLRPGSHTESQFRASPHTRWAYRCTTRLPIRATEGGGE